MKLFFIFFLSIFLTLLFSCSCESVKKVNSVSYANVGPVFEDLDPTNGFYQSNKSYKNKSIFKFENDAKVVEVNSFSREQALEKKAQTVKVIATSKTPTDLHGIKIKGSWVVTLSIIFLLAISSYGTLTLTRKAQMINKFPGRPILPFIGSIYSFFGPPERALDTASKLFALKGKYFRVWFFHLPLICIADANAVKALMKNRDYSVRSEHVRSNLTWALGEGLITSKGETWKEDRKTLNPFFNYQRFDGFLSSFNKHTKILLKILEDTFDNGSNAVNLQPILYNSAVDFISDSSLGLDASFQQNPDHPFIHFIRRMVQWIQLRISQPLYNLPIVWYIFGFGRKEAECQKVITDFLTPIINKRREKKRPLNQDGDLGDSKPFIDSLIDAGKSKKDIVDQMITIFAAGSDSTASAINFVLFFLALYPKSQIKVQQEIKHIFGDDTNRDVKLSDLTEMKYLEMCIKEALRIYSPVPHFMKMAPVDIEIEDGLVIPKGVDALVSLHHLHRDPQVFPDPETFDPERFTPEQCAKRSLYAYLPFSVGSRNCIGQKYAMILTKTVVASILRKFNVSTVTKQSDLEILVGVSMELLTPGICLKLTKREDK